MKNIFKPTPDSSKTICLLLFFLLAFVQQSYGQRITRQYNNVSFSEALKDLVGGLQGDKEHTQHEYSKCHHATHWLLPYQNDAGRGQHNGRMYAEVNASI